MEGGGADGHPTATESRLHPTPDVAGGASREGEQGDLVPPRLSGFDKGTHPAYQELGLSGARPGHHDLGAVGSGERGAPVFRLEPDLGQRHLLIVGSGRLGKAGNLRDQIGFDPVFGQEGDRISERVGVRLGDFWECLEVAHIGQAIGRV